MKEDEQPVRRRHVETGGSHNFVGATFLGQHERLLVNDCPRTMHGVVQCM